jgi:TRAP-type mannitol/chloroaromatic compound transport system permease small subunit
LPGLYLLKTVILVFCVLILLQGLSLAGRSLLVLMGHEKFAPPEEEHEGV